MECLGLSTQASPPSGTWDSGNAGNNVWPNTTPAADFFLEADDAIFSQAPSPTAVNIAAGGVTPNSTTISNASGTYTFTGAGIIGGATLAKSNGGAMVCSNTDTVAGSNFTGEQSGTFLALTQQVPEPSSLVALLGATLLCLRRRRQFVPQIPLDTNSVIAPSLSGHLMLARRG